MIRIIEQKLRHRGDFMKRIILILIIADASSKLIKKYKFNNIKKLPYKYKLDVSDVVFTRGLTYSINVHIDLNNNSKLNEGDYGNSIRHEINFSNNITYRKGSLYGKFCAIFRAKVYEQTPIKCFTV